MATRLIKWVGDPLVTTADGDIPDWKYENKRSIVVPMLVENTGTHRRIGKKDGLSYNYEWRANNPTMVVRMRLEDWEILHAIHPYEFKDVSRLDETEWGDVQTDHFVVPEGSLVGLPTPRLLKPLGPPRFQR